MTKFTDDLWVFWTPRGGSESPCLVCMKRPAVALHHITPRSMDRDTVEDVWNIIPVCNECHGEVDGDGARDAELREKVVARAQSIIEWRGKDTDRVLFEHEE